MRLVISGYYGFRNAGDEAILAALLQGLRERFPDAALCVLSADPQETAARHGVATAQRWSAREVWRALGAADALIQGGGGLLQDTTSVRSPLYYLGVLRLARLRRVPAMVFAQGLGPLRGGLLRRLTARELTRVAAITVRDERSLEELTALGVSRPQAALAADPAVLLRPAPGNIEASLAAAGVEAGAPRALLALRPWPGAERAVAACAALAGRLADHHGLQVVAAPFQAPQDVELAGALAAAEPCVRILPPLADPAELVAHVAAARLVVTMRLHGLIFAASQAVPAVGISYDPKLDAFAARARRHVIRLEDCTADVLIEPAEQALDEAETGVDARRATARELRQAAEVSFRALAEVLSGKM